MAIPFSNIELNYLAYKLIGSSENKTSGHINAQYADLLDLPSQPLENMVFLSQCTIILTYYL